MAARKRIDAATLRDLLHYDPETGVFTWKVNRKGKAMTGAVAGNTTGRYRKIQVCGRAYLAHRLAYFYMTGRWPESEIDHKDGDRLNNRWSNLRVATRTQNAQNCRKQTGCSSSYKGVYLNSARKDWHAQIRIDGKRKHLGYFRTEEDAYAAYCAAAAKHFGEYAKT